jgi:hypothetical protein
VLNRSNEYDTEIHRLRLTLEHSQAEQNSLKILIDRLQQQLKQAEDEVNTTRKESLNRVDPSEKDIVKLQN